MLKSARGGYKILQIPTDNKQNQVHYKRIPRPSVKHRYRPQRVNLRELRREPKSVPPRVVYIQNP